MLRHDAPVYTAKLRLSGMQTAHVAHSLRTPTTAGHGHKRLLLDDTWISTQIVGYAASGRSSSAHALNHESFSPPRDKLHGGL